MSSFARRFSVLLSASAVVSVAALAHAATFGWERGPGIPSNALVGGQEPGRSLYVCHAPHNGGVHPGKVVAGNCNIGWGGKEVVLPNFEVLTVNGNPRWVPASNGSVPQGAFAAGHENGAPLYLCRTGHAGGVHPGKVVGNNCNIGYGGAEILHSNYEVLVP